jgi:hypothetical protein
MVDGLAIRLNNYTSIYRNFTTNNCSGFCAFVLPRLATNLEAVMDGCVEWRKVQFPRRSVVGAQSFAEPAAGGGKLLHNLSYGQIGCLVGGI